MCLLHVGITFRILLLFSVHRCLRPVSSDVSRNQVGGKANYCLGKIRPERELQESETSRKEAPSREILIIRRKLPLTATTRGRVGGGTRRGHTSCEAPVPSNRNHVRVLGFISLETFLFPWFFHLSTSALVRWITSQSMQKFFVARLDLYRTR